MSRRFLTYITSIVLIAIYIVSYIGFSIHTCTCEQTTQISILIGNPSCESLHAHINLSKDIHRCDCHHEHHRSDSHSESDEKCDSNHQDGCCSTEVLVMTSEQTSPDHQTLFDSLSSEIIAVVDYPQLLEETHLSDIQVECMSIPYGTLRHTLSYISVWRL